MWERSFVAASVLVGGSVDDTVAMLGDGGAARARDLVTRLQDPKRATRAAALAEAARDVSLAIDEATLR